MQNQVSNSLIFLGTAIILSAIVAPLLISLLYKLQFTVQHALMKDKSNEEFYKLHKQKSGTPNMGGILIWLIVPILTLILVGVNTFTITFSMIFSIWGLMGFFDGILVLINKTNLKFRQFQETFEWRLGKLAVMFLVGIFSSHLIFSNITIKQFGHLAILGSIIDLPELLIITIFGVIIVFGIYAFEITDGLDGLLAGLSIRSLFSFFLLLLVQGQYEFLPIIGITLGVLFVYLYFNIPPARVFMGGAGAMPLGAMMLLIAIITNNLIPYVLISLIMWIELASSATQIISIRFFKRRVFKLAPLHHHFEALGWPETKVVMRFWLFHAVFCVGGILVGLI